MNARTLLRAWLLTATVDFLFASTLSTVFYGSTFAALWQGVASVLIGPRALDGGAATVAIGLGMHVLVAFTWTAVLLLLLHRIGALRALLVSPWGALKVAALYGPLVWLVMSFVVIQSLTGRAPLAAPRRLVLLTCPAPPRQDNLPQAASALAARAAMSIVRAPLEGPFHPVPPPQAARLRDAGTPGSRLVRRDGRVVEGARLESV